MKNLHWRGILASMPLPMLALAASYGVYQYAMLFVPLWVAIVQAAAFEATYLGLAALRSLDAAQRRRAGLISVGAVVVSILYNSLAGLFHRQPDILVSMPWWGNAILAVLHGAPLAWVAYLVADLLLHNAPHEDAQDSPMPTLAYARDGGYPAPELVARDDALIARFTPTSVGTTSSRDDALIASVMPQNAPAPEGYGCPHCGAALASAGQLGAARRWGHCAQCK